MACIFHDRVLQQKPTAQRTDKTKRKEKRRRKGGRERRKFIER